jgi:aminoglycoside phosphotransferase (APT) family kinase protein
MVDPVQRLEQTELPPEIARALRETFGDAPIERMALLKGGRSGAMILSLTVAGKGYVVRRGDPTRTAHSPHVAREIACLRIASARGVAPPLHHADADTGVVIMDWIDVAPFWSSPSRGPERIARVASTLRRLHDGPAFPPGPGALPLVRHTDDFLRERGGDGLPPGLRSTLEAVSALTRRFAGDAPCHNDLNPGNLLEAPEALYFVDWDTAAQGDPFVDLGQLGVFTFPMASQRDALLEAYLGHPPTELERARATVARVRALGVYATAFLHVAALEGAPPGETPTPASIPEMLAMLGARRERAPAAAVAASLLAEMQRELATQAFEAATRLLECPPALHPGGT